MQTLPKLYKRDNTGKTRVWWAEISGALYRLNSGELQGGIITSKWTRCVSKNEGRSNETSGEEQCQKEVEALYTKKKKRGYTKNQKEVDQIKEILIKPMLAHKFEDYSGRIDYLNESVFSQPKLDGIRCIARPDGLWSRKGEPITSVPHIADTMIRLAKDYQTVFDGELYNHDLKADFNRITSLVRRQKQSQEHLDEVKQLVQYHIYDLAVPERVFSKRLKQLKIIMQDEIYDTKLSKHLIMVETQKVVDPDELDQYYGIYLEQGYEGQMVRRNSSYVTKRTDMLLKRKEFQDEEFEIVGFEEGRGNRSGMVGAAILKLDRKRTFNAALMGTNEYRETIWSHRDTYIGMQATVKYFHKTPDGIPRFPVVKSIGI